MKITVINKRPTGGMPVTCVDSTQCKPGETHVMLGRFARQDYIQQMMQSDGNSIIVRAQLDAMDYPPMLCIMKKPADPAGGVNVVVGEGFDLKEIDTTTDANVVPQMWIGAYSDAACTIPNTTSSFATPTKGAFVSGSGTNIAKVTPDATGEFACTLTDTVDETVYIKAWPVASDYYIDSSDSHHNAFTP